MYNPTRSLIHQQPPRDRHFMGFNRLQGNGLSTDNLLERLMMTGKHSRGLPPKAPSWMPHLTGSLDRDDNGPKPIHQPSTLVPPAFNPVFWLLQSGAVSSSEPGGGGSDPFPVHAQHGAPEIEMRLGPFAPNSSGTSHDYHGGSFQDLLQDPGDLSSITANLQLRSGAGPAHEDAVNVGNARVQRPFRWEGHNGSEPSSSSTSNETGISPPGSHLMFQETGGNQPWSSADTDPSPSALKSCSLSAQTTEEPSTRSRFSSNHEPSDCDTVMKWCALLPTQGQNHCIDQLPASARNAPVQHHEHNPRQNHADQLSQSQMDHPLGNGSSGNVQFTLTSHCMNWQMHASHGGQDAMFDSVAPMSQELQRMAAVLDQI